MTKNTKPILKLPFLESNPTLRYLPVQEYFFFSKLSSFSADLAVIIGNKNKSNIRNLNPEK